MTCFQWSNIGVLGLLNADMLTSVLRVSVFVIVPSKSRIQWMG